MHSKPCVLVSITFLVLCSAAVSGQDVRGRADVSRYGSVSVQVEPLIDVKEGISFGEQEPLYRVFLVRGAKRYQAHFRNGGTYEASIPEGIYQVVLKTRDFKSVFFKRANFRVVRNQSVHITIPITESDESCDKKLGLVIRATVISSRRGKSDFERRGPKARPPFYHEFSVQAPFRMVIKSCRRSVRGKILNFYFARLTYKDLLIEADTISLDRRKMLIRAEGIGALEVFVKHGHNDYKLKSIDLELRSGKMTLDPNIQVSHPPIGTVNSSWNSFRARYLR